MNNLTLYLTLVKESCRIKYRLFVGIVGDVGNVEIVHTFRSFRSSRTFRTYFMSEYLTEALVLNKEPLGEADSRIVLFSKDFGKIIVKAKSSRKIDSKLNGHLEPLNKVIIRIVERVGSSGFQVVDALRFGHLSSKLLSILYVLEKIAPLNQMDARLWHLVKSIPSDRDPVNIKILIKKILSVSGFGPDLATCYACGRKPTRTFIYESANFVCGVCLHHSKISVDEVLSI